MHFEISSAKSRPFCSNLNMWRNTQTTARVLVLSKPHMTYNGEVPERLSEPHRTDQSTYQGISVSIWTSLWAYVTDCRCIIIEANYYLLKVDVARRRWLIDWMFNWLISCLNDWLIDRLIDWLISCLIDWLINQILIEWIPLKFA